MRTSVYYNWFYFDKVYIKENNLVGFWNNKVFIYLSTIIS